jgi:hypothetical protein
MPSNPEDPFAWTNAEFDKDMADHLLRTAGFAVDNEMLKPRPVSKVRNPDGGSQGETLAEYTQRISRTTILYLLEMGLLVIPEDITERLDDFFPMQRVP